MGYSCSAKADEVLKALIVQLKATNEESESSNTFFSKGNEYFYEIGQENVDSSITGSVYKVDKNGLCKKSGNFRIEKDGRISKFPYTTKEQRNSAMITGLIKFHEMYKTGWKEDELLTSLIGNAKFVVV